ncbi:hypothetical protein MKK50_18185 [Methylobacterium sp. J-043]|nr:hypothetical protein [Methylobacterium sp. J-043]
MRAIRFNFGEHAYRGAALNAFDQFECLNLLSQISERVRSGRARGALDQVGLITTAVEALDEGTTERLCALCLPGMARQGADGEWRPVWDVEAADLLFDDIGAARLLGLIARVIAENLQPYLTRERFDVQSEASRSLSFSVVELPGGKSWLLRPVESGMCRFESLLDGTLDLSHIALMNESISVRVENENRARAASQEKH